MLKLREILLPLAANDVDFVIIGGVAAGLHGAARTTLDVDLCYSRHPVNLDRLVRALAPFRPRLRDLPSDLPFRWEAPTLRNGFLFTLTTEIGRAHV